MSEDKTKDMLLDHVKTIADRLSQGIIDPNYEPYDEDGDEREEPTAYDWLEGALDIEYIVNSKREYLGARVLVAFGGPNIWVDTKRKIVEGFWWGDRATANFEDHIGLDDALSELLACGA